MATLDATLSADGDTDAIQWYGGKGTLFAQGTFGSGTIKVQFSLDNSTWTDLTGISLSAAGAKAIDIGPCLLKVNLNGSTDASITIRIAAYPFGK